MMELERYQLRRSKDMQAIEVFLDRIVKVESKTGNVSTGKVTGLDETFVELTHRNGLKSLISYDQIAGIAEIPVRR